jgi:peptide/nickel transport system substrate-binding protein
MVHQSKLSQLYRLFALLVIGLLVVACAAPQASAPTSSEQAAAPTEAPAEESPGGEVTRENTLIFAADLTDLVTLDPAVAYEFSGIQAEGSIYETLVSFLPGQTGVQPLLAESWAVTEEGDNFVLTFMLDANAKFASGNPVTAEDVLFSWGRAMDINKSPAFLFSDIAQITKDSLKAADAQTFVVTIPKTVSPQVFLSVISFTIAAVVEKAAVEPNMGSDFGESWLNDHSAGSGPYVLNKWERSVGITLDANPNYWGEAPKMQRVIMQNIPELANLQAAIETGDADIVQDIGPEQKAALEGNPDIQLITANNTQLVYLGMNAMKAPLDNVDVREAIRYAINYDEIITLLSGNGALVQEIIPSGFLGHTAQTPFAQDIAKAKELLAQAGVAEGIEVEMLVPSGVAPGGIENSVLAAKIQADVAQIGLTLNLKQLETAELLKIYRAQEGQIVLISWGPDFPDPDGNVTPFTNYEAKSLAWRNGWDNKEIAELGKQAALAPTAEERTALYAQLTERVFHEGPYVILYQPTRTFAIRSNIDGFNFDPSDTPGITFALIGKN